jgi:hypothetical protein
LAKHQIHVAAFPHPQAYPNVHLRADGAPAHGLLDWALGRGNQIHGHGAAAPGDGAAWRTSIPGMRACSRAALLDLPGRCGWRHFAGVDDLAQRYWLSLISVCRRSAQDAGHGLPQDRRIPAADSRSTACLTAQFGDRRQSGHLNDRTMLWP